MHKLNNIRIVLVQPSHPGNIGGAARAMKTWAYFSCIWSLPSNIPIPSATARASGADDVLAQAMVTSTLENAIADCHVVIGTSARQRAIPRPLLNPRQCAATITAADTPSKIALLFGREQSGLTNEELEQCHYHVHIPSHPDYSSLNLAAAVQVLCYELRMAQDELVTLPSAHFDALATQDERQQLFAHLEQVLIQLAFLNPNNPRRLMRRLQRLLQRTPLEKMEVNILRGILGAIEKLCPPTSP